MVEQDMLTRSPAQSPPAAIDAAPRAADPRPARATGGPGPTPARPIPLPRGALVVVGVVALAVIALALRGAFGVIYPLGLILLCGLMMVAMMSGMHRMGGMFGSHHGGSDERSASEAGSARGGGP